MCRLGVIGINGIINGATVPLRLQKGEQHLHALTEMAGMSTGIVTTTRDGDKMEEALDDASAC